MTHRVYAPDLPGFGSSGKPAADYSPAFFARSISTYLDALGDERAAVAGNSLGALVALRLALSEPQRASALALVDSAGLGREVVYALRLPTLPGYGEGAVAWGKTPLGALGRAWSRVPLLFELPGRVPAEWITEQTKIAQLPGFSGRHGAGRGELLARPTERRPRRRRFARGQPRLRGGDRGGLGVDGYR